MYGRGIKSIAEQLECSTQEAKDIQEGFFKEFPKVKKWIDYTTSNATKVGFVEDVWGRRRRLPDLMLPKFEVVNTKTVKGFNPLLGSSGLMSNDDEAEYFINQLAMCNYKSEVDAIKRKAVAQGYKVTDNGGFISRSERQCVNARIQGGAASMSKKAMLNVFNNKELKALGFKLLIVIHDEIIGECPIENKERVKELLSQEMINSALPEIDVPMKCDIDDFKSWYEDVYSSEVNKEYTKLLDDSYSEKEAFNIICERRCECTAEQLKEIMQ